MLIAVDEESTWTLQMDLSKREKNLPWGEMPAFLFICSFEEKHSLAFLIQVHKGQG